MLDFLLDMIPIIIGIFVFTPAIIAYFIVRKLPGGKNPMKKGENIAKFLGVVFLINSILCIFIALLYFILKVLFFS